MNNAVPAIDTLVNHQLRLAARPVGLAQPGDWQLDHAPVSAPAEGGLLVQVLALSLGACRAWGVASEKRPQRGQFLPDLQAHSSTMGQKAGEKWAAEAVS